MLYKLFCPFLNFFKRKFYYGSETFIYLFLFENLYLKKISNPIDEYVTPSLLLYIPLTANETYRVKAMTAVAPGVGVPRTEALAQQRFLKCPNVTVLKQISLKSLKLVLLRKTIKVPRICNRKTKLLIQFHTKKTNPIGRAHACTHAQ